MSKDEIELSKQVHDESIVLGMDLEDLPVSPAIKSTYSGALESIKGIKSEKDLEEIKDIEAEENALVEGDFEDEVNFGDLTKLKTQKSKQGKEQKNDKLFGGFKHIKIIRCKKKQIIVEKFNPKNRKSKVTQWRKWKKELQVLLGDGFTVVSKGADGKVDKTYSPDGSVSVTENSIEKKKRKKKLLEDKLRNIKIIDDPEEDFEQFIEIAVSCTWFQKRLSWMMSSVLNQKGDVPKILFNVAYPKDNGDPTTETVCQFFRDQGLNVKETVYDGFDVIQYRGFVRNRQIMESKAKWMLFADSDMAYDPFFFSELAKQLRSDGLRKESRCISASRVSLDKAKCKEFFNSDPSSNYPKVIDTSIVKSWPVFRKSRSCGAGYFQLFNVRTMRENTDGLYVDSSSNPDLAEHDNYHKTYSDKKFRKKINGVRNINTLPQYHLNHERDNEAKTHLILQR